MGLRQLRHSNHSTGKFACSVSDTDALSSESCSAPSDWNVYKISATTSATACKAEDCPAGHRCWHFDQVHSSITPSYLLYIWSYSHNYGYICQDQWEFQDPKVGTVAYKVLKAYTLNFSPYKGLTKNENVFQSIGSWNGHWSYHIVSPLCPTTDVYSWFYGIGFITFNLVNWSKLWSFIIWLMVWNMFYFSIYWECHHPNWRTHIFQRGRAQPPTRYVYVYIYIDIQI